MICQGQACNCTFFFTSIQERNFPPTHIVKTSNYTRYKAVSSLAYQFTISSLAYQFTINGPLMWPHFRFLDKFWIFSLVLAKITALKSKIIPQFCSRDHSFFMENLLPRPYFWKPVWYIPKKKRKEKKKKKKKRKKVSAPPPPV